MHHLDWRSSEFDSSFDSSFMWIVCLLISRCSLRSKCYTHFSISFAEPRYNYMRFLSFGIADWRSYHGHVLQTRINLISLKLFSFLNFDFLEFFIEPVSFWCSILCWSYNVLGSIILGFILVIEIKTLCLSSFLWINLVISTFISRSFHCIVSMSI